MPAVGDEDAVVPDEDMVVPDKDVVVPDEDGVILDEDVVVLDGEGIPKEVDVPEGAQEAEVGKEEATARVTTAHEEFIFINICMLHITLYSLQS